MSGYEEILQERLPKAGYERLMAIPIPRVHEFVADTIELCDPEAVIVQDDSEEGRAETRRKALEAKEEAPLAIEGHTIHYDGPEDQGRDREVTKYLVPRDDTLPAELKQIEREEGLAEIRGLLEGSMKDRTMVVRFLCLGPADSEFSIPVVQCTDSWYVSHNLDLLYRPGYEQFKRSGPDAEVFAIAHSAGKLTDRMVSAEPDKKRIYIDYLTDTVYSVNTQYAGNSVGLKKLALRLAIRKANREGWLAEHMSLLGVNGPGGRKTYFAGAFPSACGKTSTAMLPGEKILGDDIAYLRSIGGVCRAANAESGIFGIAQGVNSGDDPAIWEVLNEPGEVVFSNMLVKDGRPYWLDMGVDPPEEGESFVGHWTKGMTDPKGAVIPYAHKNARYSVSLKALVNCDTELDNPEGVVLQGIMYGGRDAKAYHPVQEGFDWNHGIIAYGASLETETTFAVIGQEGVPEINLMSIQDFVAVPLGRYVAHCLDFAKNLKQPPRVFGVNYFLRGTDGRFVNGVRDKHVWVKWMDLRVHGEVGAARSPTGLIPKYEDLVPLFSQVLGKDYPREDYVTQFTVRIPENLAKVDRVEKFHRENVPDVPAVLFEVLAQQKARLEAAQKEYGDYGSPLDLPDA